MVGVCEVCNKHIDHMFHKLTCFPNGFKYKIGDEIIFEVFKDNIGKRAAFRIIGIDTSAYTYTLEYIYLKQATINSFIYFVDKKAIPLTEITETLYLW